MLHPGLTLGDRYVLVAAVAKGGMGEVWRADDTVLGRTVAVKVLLPNLAGDPGFAARFRTEARAMAALSDPGIVEIYDFGQAEGIAYLVMQLVDGESLSALVRRVGPLEPRRAMTLLAQAADALHVAHRQGIVHRDVKPGNLLLRPDGRLMLTDFGIARILAGDGLTGADEILGTASYLAPEQVNGEPVSPATDVYALGVVAYELLTDRRPFVGDSFMAVAMGHVRDRPPALPDQIPEPVRHVVLRALEKEPADRWSSGAALARAALEAAGAPRTPEPEPRPRRPLVAVVAAAILALLAVATLLFDRGGTEDPLADSHRTPGPTASTGVPGVTPSPTPGPEPVRTGGPTRTTVSTGTTGRPAQPPPPPSSNPTENTVPNMFGWREIEAKSELTRLGFKYTIKPRSTDRDCHVLAQDPPGGTVLSVGASVEITVGRPRFQCEEV